MSNIQSFPSTLGAPARPEAITQPIAAQHTVSEPAAPIRETLQLPGSSPLTTSVEREAPREAPAPLPRIHHSQSSIPEDDEPNGVSVELDGEARADGSGIGEEDGDDEGIDEDDGSEGVKDEEAAAGNSIPQYVQAEFDRRVEESRHRDRNGLPPLYANGQFFFPRRANWFILQEPSPTPEDLYNPQMFLWDVMPLCKRIPCPNCRHDLRRHSHIRRPRRCVSTNSVFWIIGYRYYCPSCKSNKQEGKPATFQSWDKRILAVLPPALAAEFPARLTHRSAMEIKTVDWLRSCFQAGMGPKQFSDALRVQHLLQYDLIHLQYLQQISSRTLDLWTGKKYSTFLPFADRSSQGFCGYVPSGKLCTSIYDALIEEHRDDFQQHMALLSAEVCSMDHSHKVCQLILDVYVIFRILMHMSVDRAVDSSEWRAGLHGSIDHNQREGRDTGFLSGCYQIARAIRSSAQEDGKVA